MKRTAIAFLASLLVTFLAIVAEAAVPPLISYQGRLTNNVGVPLDTTVALIFQIYADSNGVTSLWDETHPSVVIADGLFQVLLGSVSPIGQSVFNGDRRWLGVRLSGGPATALMPLVSTAYAYRANVTDTASLARGVSDNAITSAKIQNGTIQFGDIGQNSATNGEVIKWNGSAWEAQADATSANTSGWTDGGTVVNLTTPTDTVAINTTSRLGKLNINGDFGMNGTSSIKFGSDNNRITATGNDMRLVAEDLSVLTTEDFTFGEYGVDSWIKFDNVNRRVGIGTLTVDDGLHLENSTSGGTCWLKIQGSHATNWGQTGLRIQTPQNTWHLRMDLYTNANFPDGALSLYNSGGAKETMTWLESGNVGIGRTNPLRALHVDGSALIADSLGIGTTSPTKKLHVYGSAMVKDTLYAGAINPSLMAASRLPDEPGVASVLLGGDAFNVTGSWQAIASRQIVVPGRGYVVCLGSAWLGMYHGALESDYVTVGISESPTSLPLSRSNSFGFGSNVGSGTYSMPVACHAIFEVDAADTYEYYMVASKSGDENAAVHRPELILIYVPTAYGTVSAAKSAGLTTSEPGELFDGKHPASTSEPTAIDYAEELRQLRSEMEILKKRLDEQNK